VRKLKKYGITEPPQSSHMAFRRGFFVDEELSGGDVWWFLDLEEKNRMIVRLK